MNCLNCRRENLPGGVRCIYCGTHFAATGSASAATPEYEVAYLSDEERTVPETGNRGKKTGTAGAVGSLALLALKAKSLLTLLTAGKILLTFGTMLVSIAAYSRLYGWGLAVGFVVSIFVHEMGHVIVNWRKGIAQTPPMFIPFLGALILIKKFPDNPTMEAESGAGGPVAGALAAFACLAVAHFTGSPYWYTLAFLGCSINLFNLIPFLQLDGAHMAAAFSPKVWSSTLLVLLLWALKMPPGFLWLLIIFGFVIRLGHVDTGRYLLATPAARARIALVYVVLAISLGWGADHTMKMAMATLHRDSGTTRSAAASGNGIPSDARTVTSESSGNASSKPGTQPGAAATVVLAGALAGAAALLWWLTTSLLAKAGQRRMNRSDGALIAAMGAGAAFLWLALHVLQPGRHEGWTLIGAYFAAAGAALVYAAYSAIRLAGNKGVAPASFLLLARCLGWAICGALLVGWWQSGILVCVLAGVVAAVYYLRHPWQLRATLGGAFESVSDNDHALQLLEQAAVSAEKFKRLAEAAELWRRIAVLNHKLDRGAAAVAAMDRYSSALADQPPVPIVVYAEAVNLRAGALGLAGRHDEAVACCEEMLRVASEITDGRTAPVINFLVHVRIGRLAQLRGWYDEASAQAIWCLRYVAPSAKLLRAGLHLAQAQALAGMAAPGTSEEAGRAAAVALAGSGEADIRAGVAIVLTQAALRDADTDTANRESERGLRLLPGNLGGRYWRARAILASGDKPAGDIMLQQLATDFPTDYWGLCARAELTEGAGLARRLPELSV